MFDYLIAVQQNTIAAGILLALLFVRTLTYAKHIATDHSAGTATSADAALDSVVGSALPLSYPLPENGAFAPVAATREAASSFAPTAALVSENTATAAIDAAVAASRRRFLLAVLIGAGVAAVLTVLKIFTGWINTELWTMGFTLAVLAAAAAFLLVDFGVLFRRDSRRAAWFFEWSISLLAASVVALVLRGDLLYLREFVLQGESILSVNVVYRALGWLAAFCVTGLSLAGIALVARRLGARWLKALTTAILAVFLLQGLLAVLQILFARHMIPRVSWLRELLTLVINYNDAFLYATMLLALVIVALGLVAQRRFRHPSATLNAAQRRQMRAHWRRLRRWSTVVVACFAITLLSTTVVKAYTEREIELTPAESMEYVDDAVHIPISQIEDGHLHRFAHQTEAGTEVRFIVIKKNEIAYGVGLDACMICGATGYYERDDQVVCKMCDVVMNKQTIGFAGGCNPIPLEFLIENGTLLVRLSDLEAGAEWFQ